MELVGMQHVPHFHGFLGDKELVLELGDLFLQALFLLVSLLTAKITAARLRASSLSRDSLIGTLPLR
jgi:hypothetical protein